MSPTKRTIVALSVLLSGAAISHHTLDQNQPQINVPYRCANGITYTVLNCKPYRADQWCRTTEEQNGNLVTTFDSAWSSMPGRLQGCTTAPVVVRQAAPAASSQSPSAAPQVGVYHCTNGFTLTISRCGKLSGRDACYFKMEDRGKVLIDAPGTAVGVEKIFRACQGDRTGAQSAPHGGDSRASNPTAADSDYVAGMPSVERVKNAIKGTDPTDTLALQRGVLLYLVWYIGNIKYARTVTGPYTPSEQRVVSEYQLATNQIDEDYKKTHTPAEFQAFQQLSLKYGDTRAPVLIRSLIGQQAADAYRAAQRSYNRQQQPAQRRATPEHHTVSIFGVSINDPDGIFTRMNASIENQPEVRRCLELGGSLGDCKDEGTIRAVGRWTNTESTMPPDVAGVVLVGGFHGKSGASFSFGEDLANGSPKALLQNCGSLVATAFADTREYSIRKVGSTVKIAVANEPEPIVITMQPDGSLLGPGSVLVKGRIVTGYTTTTTTVTVNGLSPEAQGYYCSPGPCTSHSLPTPNFEQKIERCTIGSMAYVPPAPPVVHKTGIGLIDNMELPKPLVQGFRMTGRYAGNTGLNLEFDNHAITLDCGRAHAKVPYTVDNTSAGFVVRVQNAGGAFLLSVAQDGTLHGSGTTTVNGRLLTSFHDENVSFTPHSESCQIGTFAASK